MKKTLRPQKKKSNFWKWVLTIFFGLGIYTYPFSITGIMMLLAALLTVPIEPWQNFIGKYINGKWILVLLLFVGAMLLSEDTETPPADVPTYPSMNPREETTFSPHETEIIIPTATAEPIITLIIEPTMTATTEPTVTPTVQPTATPTIKPTVKPTEKVIIKPTEESVTYHYILNTNTKKFHYPSCGSAAKIKTSNRSEYSGTREEIIAQGYSPCGNCDP